MGKAKTCVREKRLKAGKKLYPRGVTKTSLYDLEAYGRTNIKKLNQLCVGGYQDYEVEVRGAGCSCYYDCSCNDFEILLMGINPETNAEWEARVEETLTKTAAAAEILEAGERAQLERLQKKYEN